MEPQSHSHYPGVHTPLTVEPGICHPVACPYLPGRSERVRAYQFGGPIPPDAFEALLDAGFRRSGRFVYQPVCRGCRECVPLRVPVASFAPSKSQRRWVRKNADLKVAVDRPAVTPEVRDLYARYLRQWHGRTEPLVETGLNDFLYDTPVETLEFRYRTPAGRLVAVGVCDVTPHVLSSVYFFFDPSESVRRLGTFGAMVEIDHARSHGKAYYHLGYRVQGCGPMAYKADFRPHELLRTDGTWAPALEDVGRGPYAQGTDP